LGTQISRGGRVKDKWKGRADHPYDPAHIRRVHVPLSS
jgi:hypothetical protein